MIRGRRLFGLEINLIEFEFRFGDGARRGVDTPAENIEQAVSYFGDTVAVYVDSGPITNSLPSKIIAINDDDEIEIIRD